jgi:solute carrier family 25 (mitochondrial carnitine/acylcarnitine transporter), member 20/29
LWFECAVCELIFLFYFHNSGVVQSFVTSPVELVKVAQQCSSSTTPRLLAAAHSVLTQRTALRGLNATLLRDGLPHGVWFLAYDVSKTTLMQQYSIPETVPVEVSLASGALAATVAWAVGYPADLIKTRIQASAVPRGIVETARTIVHEADGRIWAGLYRGFGMKLVRSIPASMIGFTVYEGVKERIVSLLNTVH